MNGSTTQPARIITHRQPDVELIGPVRIDYPTCDKPLGYQLRITLESAWDASKRPVSREIYIACPACRRAWVAALWLSLAAFAADGRAS